MKEVWNIILLVLATVGGFIGYFLGARDGVLITLLVFVVADYISGVLVAIVSKKLSSEIGFKGLFKKVLIFVLVGVGNMLDVHLLDGAAVLRTAVIFFYIANEGISLVENAANLGLPVPDKLKNVLVQIKTKAEGGVDTLTSLKSPVLSGNVHTITSHFGQRVDPITLAKNTYHGGIDLVGVNSNVNVLAFADGEVVALRSNVKGVDKTTYTAGNYVTLRHPDGKHTRYLHMAYQSIKVKVGDKVKKGQVLGVIGNTGYSTGIHLHFEVWEGDSLNDRVDPLPYLKGEKTITNAKTENTVHLLNKTVITITATKEFESASELADATRVLQAHGFAIYTTTKTVSAAIIKSGDTVTVKPGAKTYTGGTLASWVNNGSTTFKVLQVTGDRVVIGNTAGQVTAALKLGDVTKKA
jgi:toxin secretion/phage lysis holin